MRLYLTPLIVKSATCCLVIDQHYAADNAAVGYIGLYVSFENGVEARQTGGIGLHICSQSYFYNDDRFNYNYAQAKATAGNYKEAQEIFVLIQSEKIKNDYTCLWLARCYGQFYYATKAFGVLERLDPNPEYWEGKRGACVGVFQQIIAGHEPRETLRDILQILRNTGNPQVEYIICVMKKWAKDNRAPVS
ncbi:intraflagellar transport protein 56-like isoform X2 [Patiria miniata]|uniref:Uncharacterized protein n=1 Tax=Patiria miniata TaxID=46514 RepID=A0A914B340_PATMI|nr:intraflagellar transport protein 56-like isoform X2 [Patiria miniata]XP_038070445.1 intraflagellar transport protein 56-like isoform X2 [Patiria miniata]